MATQARAAAPRTQRMGLAFAVLTVLIGLALAGAVVVFLSQTQRTVTVVRAVRDIPAFTQLTAADVRAVSVPAAAVPEGALRSVEDAIGRFALGPIAQEQTLMRGNVADVEADRSLLKSKLTQIGNKGTRAFAVPVAAQDLFGGEQGLKPGDRVDVIAVVKLDTGQNRAVEFADTILQNVPVLAVLGGGGGVSGGDQQGAVVLAVSHEQAQMLAFAQAKGTLRLALVPYASEDQPTQAITTDTFLQRLNLQAAPAGQ